MPRTPSGNSKPLTWTPPNGTVAQVSFELIPERLKDPRSVPEGLKIGNPSRMLAAFHKHLGLPYKEHGDVSLKLDDKRWPAILAATDKRKKSAFHISALWFEEPKPDPVDPHNWYDLESGGGEFRGPARAPADRHFMWDEVEFASQKFVDCIRKHKLTGLEFLPLPERFAKVKPSPMQWYEVFATHPIGRGLDHPLLDADKHMEGMTRPHDPLHPSRRWGQHVVEPKLLRDDVTIDHPRMVEIIKARPPHLRIVGHERFTREHLPATDFAYFNWGWTDTGKLAYQRTFRSIFCNDRARRALIDDGIFKPVWFGPFQTVPAAESQRQCVAILDRTVKHPLPQPFYTPEQLKAERAKREALATHAKAKPSATPTPTNAAQVAAAIKKRTAAGDPPWPFVSARELAKVTKSPLFKLVPQAWQILLPFLPSVLETQVDGEPFEFTLIVPEWNTWSTVDEDDRPAAEKPSPKDLWLALTPYGDWYSVRIKGGKATADARIIHWDHETLTVAEEWPSIAAFVSFMLAASPPKK